MSTWAGHENHREWVPSAAEAGSPETRWKESSGTDVARCGFFTWVLLPWHLLHVAPFIVDVQLQELQGQWGVARHQAPESPSPNAAETAASQTCL